MNAEAPPFQPSSQSRADLGDSTLSPEYADDDEDVDEDEPRYTDSVYLHVGLEPIDFAVPLQVQEVDLSEPSQYAQCMEEVLQSATTQGFDFVTAPLVCAPHRTAPTKKCVYKKLIESVREEEETDHKRQPFFWRGVETIRIYHSLFLIPSCQAFR